MLWQLRSGWQRPAPFCGRLRNRIIVAFGTTYTYEALGPTVPNSDMTVIRQDAIPILANVSSGSISLGLRAG